MNSLGCDNLRVLVNDLFKTNYSKRLRQPYGDLRHTVHQKHHNLISKILKFQKICRVPDHFPLCFPDYFLTVNRIGSVFEKLVLKNAAQLVSVSNGLLKRDLRSPSTARTLDRSIARSLARSLARSSLAHPLSRSVARSIGRSVARSLGRSAARSLGLSFVRSLGRSLARSLDRLIARSLGRLVDRSIDRSFHRSIARSLGHSLASKNPPSVWAVGYWQLVIGYWLLVIGYWLLAIGYWLLPTYSISFGLALSPTLVIPK